MRPNRLLILPGALGFALAALLPMAASARGPVPLEPPDPDDEERLIDVVVTGPESDDDKALECREVFARWGVQAIETAPLRVTLRLRDGANRLTITSQGKGTLYDEPRPGWSMKVLCHDALARALAIEAQVSRAGSRAVARGAVTGSAPTHAAPAATPLTAAQQKAKAQHLEASKRFDLGEFEEAAAAWSRAYGLDPRPEFLANIGNAWFRRGQIEGELRDLRTARHFSARFAEVVHGAAATEQLRQVDEAIRALK